MPTNVALNPVPSQTLQVVLGGQNCQINVYQENTGLYFDLIANGVTICTATICRNLARLLNDRQYLGFVGDFSFFDTMNPDVDAGQDPGYAGLGSQFVLLYLSPDDLAS